jgi:hypothetical protein
MCSLGRRLVASCRSPHRRFHGCRCLRGAIARCAFSFGLRTLPIIPQSSLYSTVNSLVCVFVCTSQRAAWCGESALRCVCAAGSPRHHGGRGRVHRQSRRLAAGECEERVRVLRSVRWTRRVARCGVFVGFSARKGSEASLQLLFVECCVFVDAHALFVHCALIVLVHVRIMATRLCNLRHGRRASIVTRSAMVLNEPTRTWCSCAQRDSGATVPLLPVRGRATVRGVYVFVCLFVFVCVFCVLVCLCVCVLCLYVCLISLPRY